jgi:hypothetical protein
MAKMLLNATFSDVELVVESQCFPAHKAVLSVRSEYFRLELLYL